MKKCVCLLVSICIFLALWIIPAYADGGKKSGLFTYELKGNGNAIITDFDWQSNNGQDIYIPRQIDGYNVSEIGAFAFSDEEATSAFDRLIGEEVVVVIPDTVTMIGEKAFFCTKITAITIPASVQFIGDAALAGCFYINQHSVEANNPVFATIDGVLYNKTSKELLSYPAGYKDGVISSFAIPDGITSIGKYAFAGLIFDLGKNGNLSIPSSLSNIKDYAFYKTKMNQGEWNALDLNNVNEIGDYSFAESQIGYIEGASITKIGECAFQHSYMNSSDWPFPRITSIGNYAFAGANITLDLNAWAVSFPQSLDNLGEGAFGGCTFKKSISNAVYNLVFSDCKFTTIPQYCFNGVTTGMIRLPSSLITIEDYAFAWIRPDSSASGVEMGCPSSVESIGAHAFESAALTTIGFSDESNLKSIGEYAYSECRLSKDYNQSTIKLPNGLESIGANAFIIDGITELAIPSSVTSIGDNVCDRSKVKLSVEAGSYAALYASENGYATTGSEDTSWLNG